MPDRFAVLKNEAIVGALAERLFELRGDPSRKAVEDAIKRINPQLPDDLRKVPEGTVIAIPEHIPEAPDVRPKSGSDLIDAAIDEAIDAVTGALAEVRATVAASAEERTRDAKATIELSKSSQLKSLAKKDIALERFLPAARAGAEQVVESAARQRTDEERALELVEADLKELMGSLRGA